MGFKAMKRVIGVALLLMAGILWFHPFIDHNTAMIINSAVVGVAGLIQLSGV